MSAFTNQETEGQTKKPKPVTVTVNGKAVTFQEHKTTGLEIKQTAISQGVNIQLDFVLFEVKHGGNLKPISDQEMVNLNENEQFRAVAPDDNS